MYKIRVFDQLVYDDDPNLTNVLIGAGLEIWRIDFSRAFRLYKDLRNPKDLVRCDRQLFEKLKALDGNELAGKTKGYLSKDEVKAVMARRDKIVAQFQKMISEKGRRKCCTELAAQSGFMKGESPAGCSLLFWSLGLLFFCQTVHIFVRGEFPMVKKVLRLLFVSVLAFPTSALFVQSAPAQDQMAKQDRWEGNVVTSDSG